MASAPLVSSSTPLKDKQGSEVKETVDMRGALLAQIRKGITLNKSVSRDDTKGGSGGEEASVLKTFDKGLNNINGINNNTNHNKTNYSIAQYLKPRYNAMYSESEGSDSDSFDADE